jgi:hypothetical protein
MSAVLAAISVFKLNFYKTSYIYGFGRKEDLPEGLEASFTAGYTRRESRVRPYFGITLERYYLLTKKQTYIDYSLGFGSSIYKKRLEDVNFLASMDYFGRLRNLGPGWKQRSFLSVSFARLINAELDPPLLMESPYGFQGFKNNYVGGYARATVQGESVFFSPWRLFYFKFAPFVFSSATVFQFSSEAAATNTRLYTAIGGGIRTRNESLIFGTIELRASYFPKKDAFNNNYVIQLNTNLRFKYNENFVHRPEFVSIN